MIDRATWPTAPARGSPGVRKTGSLSPRPCPSSAPLQSKEAGEHRAGLSGVGSPRGGSGRWVCGSGCFQAWDGEEPKVRRQKLGVAWAAFI